MPPILEKDEGEIEPRPVGGVFIVTRRSLFGEARPLTVNGRLVTAWAPLPGDLSLVYVTTEHPDLLAAVADDVWLVGG